MIKIKKRAIPAAFSAVACITLITAGLYMYLNRNQQVDDHYRLEFSRAEIEDNLYFDEDRDYIAGLVKANGKQEEGSELNISVEDNSHVPIFYQANVSKNPTPTANPDHSREENWVFN